MIKKIKYSALYAIATGVLLTSCGRNQDEDVELDLDTEAALVEVQVEKNFAEIDDIADQAEVGDEITKKTFDANDILAGCATLTKDTTAGPTEDTVRITVDFGITDCQGDDGNYRRGKIKIITLVNQASGVKVERKIETDGFYVNNDEYKVVRKLDYQGKNSQNQHYWQITSDADVNFADGGTLSRQSNRTRTWIAGETTLADWSDDQWHLDGTETGTRKDGKQVTTTVTQLLLIKTNCPYVTAGALKVETQGRPDFEIQYGDGTCDNKATITSQGQSWDVTL